MKYFREVNEDNVLIRNILGEFEDSLKYVSKIETTQIHKSVSQIKAFHKNTWM